MSSSSTGNQDDNGNLLTYGNKGAIKGEINLRGYS